MFAVSGDIALASELRVNRSDWTLAGQTAPGDGIVITRNKVNLGGSQNFIVRNVRFRIGQKNMAGDIQAENACAAENCANFIFDHCSFGWSVEENMNTADSHFLTVQYSIIHEGLYDAGHPRERADMAASGVAHRPHITTTFWLTTTAVRHVSTEPAARTMWCLWSMPTMSTITTASAADVTAERTLRQYCRMTVRIRPTSVTSWATTTSPEPIRTSRE